MTDVALPAQPVVIDTNVVLDLLVFADPSTRALQAALDAGQLAWLATPRMRDELQRVLDYPAMCVALAVRRLRAIDVLACFDRCCVMRPPAPACAVRCGDPDDQPFIDLALLHRALLLSKDKAVLRLRRRLADREVMVQAVFRPTA